MRSLLALLAVATLSAGLVAWLLAPDEDPSLAAALSVADAMAGDIEASGYARALEPPELTFPDDHGPHPDFRTEWWYWTGNLATAEGRPFGFQLTVFRNAVAPEPLGDRTSAWATRQVYLGHLAMTDVAGERFNAFERVARGALGLAGAGRLPGPGQRLGTAPVRVWIEDWEATGTAPGAFLPLRLAARAEGEGGTWGLELTLERGKPPVLQGEAGLSVKGPGVGNASHYYSLTRMPARGVMTVAGERFAVTGEAWMDREWSTSALGVEDVGWDWFALQLDGGSELMLYRIRRADGSASAASEGTLVAPDGGYRRIPFAAVELEVLERWRSPATGITYPAGWRLTLPAEELELTVTPRLEDQELRLSFRYWEGAVTVSGRHRDVPVGGVGYVELTGYEPE